MISEVRKYLLKDAEFVDIPIYLLQKPSENEHDHYIIYRYKLLSGGAIKDYQVTFRVISKDLVKLKSLSNKVVELLDQYRENEIPGIHHCSLLNGGGMAYNESAGHYESVLYFLIKL
ncbi:hypothetical protein [Cytobacillus sp. IB215665]|uniref:hypothetical protein n=1 Tax=Cytobacillus sp. IB215665 TaxID=3097357 RepID=UPI002A0AC96B|nr:hypothetical protein [Cytobacillus sp. IB215665]MDX8367857.1 hypothetical protein [Cytobacillus sp. IB215665]